MRVVWGALVPGIFSLLTACHQPNSGAVGLERQEYRFTGGSRCDTTTNKGVDVAVSYIQLKDDSQGAQRINDTLRQLAVNSVTSWLDSTTVASNPAAERSLPAAARLFVSDYESLTKDMGGLEGCWELNTKADTVHASPKILTVKVETYAYTGGAHPNSNLSFYTFDRETGRPLTLTDMVSDTSTLLGVVEKAFRKQQDLLPQNNLEEQGYFLRDGRFFLPANVGMSREGMVFYYNPYEIAAYAVGPIQVTVPYEHLNGVLRDEWR